MISKKRILFICTGNSCRSQMAEGFAKSMGWDAFSAGVEPAEKVNPFAVSVMSEKNIDISLQKPSQIIDYISQEMDIVATVCDHAKTECPVFQGNFGKVIHKSFPDPYDAIESDIDTISVYRRVRDDIHIWLKELTDQEM